MFPQVAVHLEICPPAGPTDPGTILVTDQSQERCLRGDMIRGDEAYQEKV